LFSTVFIFLLYQELDTLSSLSILSLLSHSHFDIGSRRVCPAILNMSKQGPFTK